MSPTKNWHMKFLTLAIVLLGFVLLVSLERSSMTLAQSETAHIRQIRSFDRDNVGYLTPVGLAFSPVANSFLVLETGAMPLSPAVSTGTWITPIEERIGTVSIGADIVEPINVTFDSKYGRFLLFDSSSDELIAIKAGPNGTMDLATLTRHDAGQFGLTNAQGMAVDATSGELFIVDSSGPRIVRAEPGPNGRFDTAVVSLVDLKATGLEEVRGIAIDPASGHLHVYSPGDQELVELMQSGQFVARRDLSEFALQTPRAMVIAPNGDHTDDPAQMSLYLADSGGAQKTGTIIEFSFVKPPEPARLHSSTSTTGVSTLVQTINAWQWDPPSTDSAGVVYMPSSSSLPNSLLVSDSEINEIVNCADTSPPGTYPCFTGANQFQATLAGALLNTLTTMSFSDEPTGVTLNPANNHLFYSDDTGTRSVYELDPGTDGIYSTGDDIVTSFKTSVFGCSDPEGITYASGLEVLFLACGVEREIYKVTPGANGVFDGVSSEGGDDVVTSFDTLSLPVQLDDPEGIAYNPDNGNLYAVGKPSDTLFEITTGGVLVQTIDISAANARKPAGLAYGPSSQSAGVKNIYIAARGEDNGNSGQNDGMVYEMTLPGTAPIPPVANVDSATVTEGEAKIINVAANDSDANGNLNPNSANSTCANGSTGCLGAANGALTDHGNGTITYTPNPSFTGPDSFVYEICDLDVLCDTATVNITVVPKLPPVANVDSATVTEGVAKIINVAANDSDANGNLNPNSANSSCAHGSSGCLGAANGTLTDHGNGTITYTPNAGYIGPDSFVYEICDLDVLCDTAPVNITVVPTLPPVANADNASTIEGVAIIIDVSGNDSDPNGNLDPNSANSGCANGSAGCAGAANGSLTDHGDGTITYNPDAGYIGPDSFVYEICDLDLLCATATVNITVRHTLSPLANDDSASTTEGEAKIINVAANDSDPNGNLNPASANSICAKGSIGCVGAANGSLTDHGDGTITYTPNAGFSGLDSFVYEICDTDLFCDTATVSIIVNAKQPPAANDDSASTAEGVAKIINVAANDSDADGDLDPNSANSSCANGSSDCAGAANGTLTDNGDGTITYTPNAGFSGPDSFVYEICDTTLRCDTATVRITVTPSGNFYIFVPII